MKHTLDLDGLDGRALEAREENATKRVAQSDTKAAFQRTHNKLAVRVCGLLGLDPLGTNQ